MCRKTVSMYVYMTVCLCIHAHMEANKRNSKKNRQETLGIQHNQHPRTYIVACHIHNVYKCYVHMYVCMHVCVYIHIYMCIYIWICYVHNMYSCMHTFCMCVFASSIHSFTVTANLSQRNTYLHVHVTYMRA